MRRLQDVGKEEEETIETQRLLKYFTAHIANVEFYPRPQSYGRTVLSDTRKWDPNWAIHNVLFISLTQLA